MPNDPGYKIINGSPPKREKIDAAKAEIPADKLWSQQSTYILGFKRLGWGKECESLLHDGLDVSASFCDQRLEAYTIGRWRRLPEELDKRALRTREDTSDRCRPLDEEHKPAGAYEGGSRSGIHIQGYGRETRPRKWLL